MERLDRDPRIDPVPGDSISREFKSALGGCIIREVTKAHGGFVFFKRDNGYYVKNEVHHIAKWRQWARKAEVVAARVAKRQGGR